MRINHHIREKIGTVPESSHLFIGIALVVGGILLASQSSWIQQYVALLWNSETKPASIDLAHDDLKKEEAYWSGRIDAVGPKTALTEVEQVYDAKNFPSTYASITIYGRQHNVAHIIGRLFLEKYGFLGIKYCTALFDYGCFHQFLGESFQKDGLQMLALSDTACAEVRGLGKAHCFHGVGHGVVGYFGYSDDDLVLAMHACDRLTKDYGKNCYYGAFMEYNLRFLDHEGNINVGDVRVMGTDPYAPCTTLESRYVEKCYASLPLWWRRVLSSDFVQMGGLCSEVTDETYHRSCVRGIGKVAALFANYQIEDAEKVCTAVPKEDIPDCLIGGAAAYAIHTGDVDSAGRFCQITPQNESTCLEQLQEELSAI